MMTNRIFGVGMLAAFAIAGGMGKMWRYEARFTPQANTGIEAVASLFAKSGWKVESSSEGRTGEPYAWVALRHERCAKILTVSVLGRTTELVRLVELYHGGDVIYAQAGRIVSAPSGLQTQIGALAHRAQTGERKLSHVSPPLLAMSPKAVVADPACTLPFT